MEDIFTQYSIEQWTVLVIAALLSGMAKAGLKGLSMLVVPLMAATFGGRPSTGLLLPILCMADLFAVRHYHRHTDWKYLLRLLPPAIIGVLCGTWLGLQVSDAVFTSMIGWIIIGTVVLLLLQESVDLSKWVSQRPWLGFSFGWLGGFTTMIGNAAGPVMAVYMLATRIPKNNYMGTIAWFFLAINLMKVPLQIGFWKNITWYSFAANIVVLPAIFIGVMLGISIVRRIPEKAFRYLIIAMTMATALKLVVEGVWR
ncbi:MAG: sulfite exporter TauE/SafE family protein [Planctomycetaceae bacterium]|nr:sulfite exporter TauE/SafE family protein [Planctomycetaceae bacterium]